MKEYKADILIGVEVNEREGKTWTKDGYTYIKYSVVGLVGIKIGESRLIHIGLRGVGGYVRHCIIGNFYCMTVTVKLDRNGKYVNYLLVEESEFSNNIGSLEAIKSSKKDMLVFNQKQQLIYSVNNSDKVYIDLFECLITSSADRRVVLVVDIEPVDMSISSIDTLSERISHFTTNNIFSLVESMFDKLQDGVYVYGDITILYDSTINQIVLPKECEHLVFCGCTIDNIVFGSSIKYISFYCMPFYLNKLYVSKDSSKEFIGALLQPIYFSHERWELACIYDEVELKLLDGERFYSVCTDARNSEVMEYVLEDKEIIIY